MSFLTGQDRARALMALRHRGIAPHNTALILDAISERGLLLETPALSAAREVMRSKPSGAWITGVCGTGKTIALSVLVAAWKRQRLGRRESLSHGARHLPRLVLESDLPRLLAEDARAITDTPLLAIDEVGAREIAPHVVAFVRPRNPMDAITTMLERRCRPGLTTVLAANFVGDVEREIVGHYGARVLDRYRASGRRVWSDAGPRSLRRDDELRRRRADHERAAAERLAQEKPVEITASATKRFAGIDLSDPNAITAMIDSILPGLSGENYHE